MTTSLEFSDERELAWLIETLPPIERFKPKSEADLYGASWEIARDLSDSPERIRTQASWIHGWRFQPVKMVEQVTPVPNKSQRHLVATTFEKELLEKNGFTDVHTIGSPFVYALPDKTVRVPRSLLVMPVHSLPHTIHDFDENIYVDEIKQLLDQFDVVVACISKYCLDRNLWKSTFEKAGIPWIQGAQVDDRNALRRMATIFRSFECVTTHSFGSHIAYAGFCGCRTSIFGTYFEMTPRRLQYNPAYVKNPRLLEKNIHRYSYECISKTYPFLFAHPTEGYNNEQWFGEQLGAENRRPAEEVAELLDWQPSWTSYASTRIRWLLEDARVLQKRMFDRIRQRTP